MAGHKLAYRACALLATALVFVGGVPTLLGAALPWEGILVTRAILGLGLGCFMPVVLGVISLMFQKESVRATMMSVASVVFNVGMIVTTNVAGILGAISWNLAWGIYLFSLVPFVLCIFRSRRRTFRPCPQPMRRARR